MKTLTVDIAKQFSAEPAGRYVDDGPHSGQVFRDKWLIPALKDSERVQIVLDGAEGYGSSFLEEAFGGLVRGGFSEADLTQRLILVSEEDPTLIDEIRAYIAQEDERRRSRGR